MATTLLLVYTPISIYFFYVNVDIVWLSYDWDAIHYPYKMWLLPVFLPATGGRGFDRWIGSMMSLFIFLYFGLAVDAEEIYRLWLLNLGFGRLFPGLKVRSAKERSWLNRLSLTRRVRLYFESTAAKPSTTTAQSDTNQ
jgi:pheromone a factor receptor